MFAAAKPPRDAIIVESAGVEERGRAFGFNRAMDHGGAMLGGLNRAS
jgi:hypothetical protein